MELVSYDTIRTKENRQKTVGFSPLGTTTGMCIRSVSEKSVFA
jgi:S-ribosylhomocysteine lyase LuxS involved in autoinducer biosynthesis